MPSLLGLNLRKFLSKELFSSFSFLDMPAFFGFLLWWMNSGPLLCNACPTGFVPGLKHRRNGFNGKVHGGNGWRRVAPGHQANNPDFRGVTIVISCDRDPGEGWGVDFTVFLCWLVWEGLMASCLAGFLSGWGEGEHKIMNVIRNHPEHTHCLCSNDAASWMAKKVRLVTLFSILPVCPLSHGEVFSSIGSFPKAELCLDVRIWYFWVWFADPNTCISCAQSPTTRRGFAQIRWHRSQPSAAYQYQSKLRFPHVFRPRFGRWVKTYMFWLQLTK